MKTNDELIQQHIASALLEVAKVDGIKPEEQALIDSFCADPLPFDQFNINLFGTIELSYLVTSMVVCGMADGHLSSLEIAKIKEIAGDKFTSEAIDATIENVRISFLSRMNNLAPESIVKLAEETRND